VSAADFVLGQAIRAHRQMLGEFESPPVVRLVLLQAVRAVVMNCPHSMRVTGTELRDTGHGSEPVMEVVHVFEHAARIGVIE